MGVSGDLRVVPGPFEGVPGCSRACQELYRGCQWRSMCFQGASEALKRISATCQGLQGRGRCLQRCSGSFRCVPVFSEVIQVSEEVTDDFSGIPEVSLMFKGLQGCSMEIQEFLMSFKSIQGDSRRSLATSGTLQKVLENPGPF